MTDVQQLPARICLAAVPALTMPQLQIPAYVGVDNGIPHVMKRAQPHYLPAVQYSVSLQGRQVQVLLHRAVAAVMQCGKLT